MGALKRIVLDVLKPHRPNGLELATAIADNLAAAKVELTVTEVDETTETVVIVIEGANLDYPIIVEAIGQMGGSVHSIDQVEVESQSE